MRPLIITLLIIMGSASKALSNRLEQDTVLQDEIEQALEDEFSKMENLGKNFLNDLIKSEQDLSDKIYKPDCDNDCKKRLVSELREQLKKSINFADFQDENCTLERFKYSDNERKAQLYLYLKKSKNSNDIIVLLFNFRLIKNQWLLDLSAY